MIRLSITRLGAAVLAAAVSCLSAAEPVVFGAADADYALSEATALVSICTPRHAGTRGARQAAEHILERVERIGLSARLDVFSAPMPGGTGVFANVVAELPGTSGPKAPWIVFLSHFDTYPNAGAGFEGANDGASTTGLLLAFAAAVRRAAAPVYNLALIWTDGEEARYAYGAGDGFQGSQHAAAEFRRLRRDVRAAVNLDMLGDRDLHIELPANGTPALNRLVLAAAKRAGLADLVAQGEGTVSDDFSAFLDAGWPATDLIDFSYGPKNGWWHMPDDTLDKISAESLCRAGLLTATLYNILDRR